MRRCKIDSSSMRRSTRTVTLLLLVLVLVFDPFGCGAGAVCGDIVDGDVCVVVCVDEVGCVDEELLLQATRMQRMHKSKVRIGVG